VNHAADQIEAAIVKSESIACVGLDPRPSLLPPALIAEAVQRFGDTAEGVGWAFTQFNKGLLSAVAGRCAAVKPQAACYESYGAAGIKALEETVRRARTMGIPVILDGKRGDIGSTASYYQQAYLGSAPGLSGATIPGMGADWLTVNGYLGNDGIAPFIGKAPTGTGIFVLVKTSNPSSGELQDQPCAGATVMEGMAKLVAQWGANRVGTCGLNDVGAVVGATYPQQAKQLRTLMPNTLFLVPGYGAQGGTAADALAGRRSDGRGVLVNSSRAIIGAWQHHSNGAVNWQDAARAELDSMNEELNALR
jgi:orotidine-5'-phosphate decarboxylase